MTEQERRKILHDCNRVLMLGEPSINDPKFYQNVERLFYDYIDLNKNIKNKQAEIDRLKEQLDQYHKADSFLAVHGWQWKDDGTEHHTEQLKDGEQ